MKAEVSKKEIKFQTKNFTARDDVPLEAIRDLCDDTIVAARNNSSLYKDTVEDICEYAAQLTSKKGGVFCHRPKVDIQEASCIQYINAHSMSDYMSVLVFQVVRTLADNNKTLIPTMESHYEHIFAFWMSKAFKRRDDVIAAEFLLVLLSDAIGWLRSKFGMGESKIIKDCLHIKSLLEKHDKDITEKQMEVLVGTGNVYHRRCDVCGCDLEVPDRGIFGRGVLITMACTVCTNAELHMELLSYTEELRKKNDRPTVEEILNERMDETWGKGSVFTIEDWEKCR